MGSLTLSSFTAAACAAMCFLMLDWWWRPAWPGGALRYWTGGGALFLGLAGVLGVAWATWRLGEFWLLSFLEHPRERARARAWIRAGLTVLLVAETARAMFSGNWVRDTVWGQLGPWVFVGILGLWGGCLSWLRSRVDMAPWGMWERRVRWFAGLNLLAASVALALDLTVLVSLYGSLHNLLEGLAVVHLVSAFGAFLEPHLERPAWTRRAAIATTVAVALLAVVLVASPAFRQHVDSRMAPAWVDEVYAGRHLRRVQLAQLAWSGGPSLEMERLSQLRERWKLVDTDLDTNWNLRSSASHRPPELFGPEQVARRAVENVVVFYVDTLRADVARDPKVMPHLAAFRERSLDFQNAYSTGSDTMRSLPALTGGNYFISGTHPGALTRLANDGPHRSMLIIPRSAGAFLRKLRPDFAFERTIEVADYHPHEKVWGYGGHRPTASRIVDEARDFLRQTTAEPFFLWLFHFDQHAWRELDENYVSVHGREPTDERARYEAVARATDRQFGRFLEHLEASGHARTTAVLFVSDHGEALGQQGHWVHSIFLWESLIRVPLVLHIPGVPARQVQTVVSLVDVAPTLAPILGGGPALYHGEDLLPLASDAGEARFERQLPILLRGAAKNRLRRLGVLDPLSGYKLVFRMDALFPELYAFRNDPRDRRNLARHRPEVVERLLGQAATSPLFPRSLEDFDLLRQTGELGPLRFAAEGGVANDSEEQPSFHRRTEFVRNDL